eukprot:2811127-Pyramimonas_sp.AAC.1
MGCINRCKPGKNKSESLTGPCYFERSGERGRGCNGRSHAGAGDAGAGGGDYGGGVGGASGVADARQDERFRHGQLPARGERQGDGADPCQHGHQARCAPSTRANHMRGWGIYLEDEPIA